MRAAGGCRSREGTMMQSAGQTQGSPGTSRTTRIFLLLTALALTTAHLVYPGVALASASAPSVPVDSVPPPPKRGPSSPGQGSSSTGYQRPNSTQRQAQHNPPTRQSNYNPAPLIGAVIQASGATQQRDAPPSQRSAPRN